MARVHQMSYAYDQPLEKGDIHAGRKTYLKDERSIILEHARHFVEKVEAIITIQQWKQFEKLTIDCKSWVRQELQETQKSLNFMLSESQKQAILSDTENLKQQLGSLIDEYSIVKQSSNQLVLALRNDFEEIIVGEQNAANEPATRYHKGNYHENLALA